MATRAAFATLQVLGFLPLSTPSPERILTFITLLSPSLCARVRMFCATVLSKLITSQQVPSRHILYIVRTDAAAEREEVRRATLLGCEVAKCFTSRVSSPSFTAFSFFFSAGNSLLCFKYYSIEVEHKSSRHVPFFALLLLAVVLISFCKKKKFCF